MKQKEKRVEIHYDQGGQILGIIDLEPQNGVAAGVFAMQNAKSIIVELTAAQRKLSLAALHAGHYVDVRNGPLRLRAHKVFPAKSNP